jgi:hypothetical protein
MENHPSQTAFQMLTAEAAWTDGCVGKAIGRDSRQVQSEVETGERLGQRSGEKVIKLFAAVIYCHFTVILAFCAIKLYYLWNSSCIFLTKVIKHNLT